jgi:hypothetical protein
MNKDASNWSRFDIGRPEFEGLLRELEALVAAEASGPVDAKKLREEITYVVSWYGADRYVADYVSKLRMHELAQPLPLVIELLKAEENERAIIVALGGNPNGTVDIKYGAEHRRALIADLEKIARVVPTPSKRPAHRPPRLDLRLLVGTLANYWLLTTGRPFTSLWAKRDPVSAGAQFVHAVVSYIDPAGLSALPRATEWVVNARRKGKVPGWFGDEGRRAATSNK